MNNFSATIKVLKEIKESAHKHAGNRSEQWIIALDTAINNLEFQNTASDLFNRWSNCDLNDDQYHFYMQNLVRFGKTLE